MDEWIKIFRVGRWKNRDWTIDDIDKIVKNFSKKEVNVPVVINHGDEHGNSSKAAAYGWVEKVKRDGDFLVAKFRDLVPEFVEAIKKKMLPERSIRLVRQPDGSWDMRHVAWLGAAPPAVTGLGNIFDNSYENSEHFDIVFFDFVESKLAASLLKNYSSSRDDKVFNQPSNVSDEVTRLKQEIASLKQSAQKTLNDFHRQKFKAEVESLNISPSIEQAGIVDFLMLLQDFPLDFAVGTSEQHPVEWFQEFLKKINLNFSQATHPYLYEVTEPPERNNVEQHQSAFSVSFEKEMLERGRKYKK
jgi:hypothetical protein